MTQSKLIAETRIETPLLPDGVSFTIHFEYVIVFVLIVVGIKLVLDYFGDND